MSTGHLKTGHAGKFILVAQIILHHLQSAEKNAPQHHKGVTLG
jgi:hypothetical protein